MIPHDSPSLLEALPGPSGEPSQPHRGPVAAAREGHTVYAPCGLRVRLHCQRLQADEGGIGVDDHAGRDRLHVGAHPALVCESRAEFRSFQICEDPWRDAAGDEYAAARPICEREVARHRAEECAEHVERGAAGCTAALETGAGDGRRIASRDLLPVDCRDCALEIFQPRTRYGALAGRVAEALAQMLDDAVL